MFVSFVHVVCIFIVVKYDFLTIEMQMNIVWFFACSCWILISIGWIYLGIVYLIQWNVVVIYLSILFIDSPFIIFIHQNAIYINWNDFFYLLFFHLQVRFFIHHECEILNGFKVPKVRHIKKGGLIDLWRENAWDFKKENTRAHNKSKDFAEIEMLCVCSLARVFFI